MADLIDRQAALNTVQNMYDRCDTGSMQDYHDLLMEAFEILPSADVPQWIPCSEKLPAEDYWTGAGLQYSADVLMTVYNAEDEETIIDYGHTVDGRWYSDTTDCFVPSRWKVLAWIPVPGPWEGEQNG